MITHEILSQYEPTIGIECHVQLKTATKLFSGADNDAREAAPNTTVSPICFGLPGTLPVLNKSAVALAIRAGIALNAEIAHVSSFDRKHYFYPDLPKGYQITQLERPIVGQGKIDVPLDGGTFEVRITRAHMEEDAGKLTHPGGADYSLVDLNRAGTPLVEVVSEADMKSPEQAKAFAQELYLLMKFAGVSEANLYHGNMRFDVNISVAKKGAKAWGTRVEIKNLNSFRSVEKAAEFEYRRQVELIEKGETIVQETRGWDDSKQKTFSQRSKEEAQDYRYFPDADIPPIVLDDEVIAAQRNAMPLLPPEFRARWQPLGLDQSVINALLSSLASANAVTQVQATAGDEAAKRVAHWFSSTVTNSEQDEPNNEDANISGDIDTASLIELATMAEKSEVSSTAAKDIFKRFMQTGESPRAIAEEQNLLQVSDSGEIEAIVDQVLADPSAQKAVEDIKAGNDKAIGFLVGQVMKLSKGKA
ncbi:Asp-tRNA(Asn)/Glu-tRNA(Gln) amidotransferase subunit GatB, partial [Candidatus Saccharibacteria bacterium]